VQGASVSAVLEKALKERWLPVVGYEGLYEVSSEGRVRSLDRRIGYRGGRTRLWRGRVHVAHERSDGYLVVPLSRNGKVARRYLQRLVAEAFIGPPPTPEHEAAHDNGDRTDNRAANIEWKTAQQNTLDKERHGTMRRGENHGMSVFTVERVRLARRLIRQGEAQRAVAARVGVSRWTLNDMLNGRTWTHV
jgi:hypothetical protein